jgi:hypothetical protein
VPIVLVVGTYAGICTLSFFGRPGHADRAGTDDDIHPLFDRSGDERADAGGGRAGFGAVWPVGSAAREVRVELFPWDWRLAVASQH